MNSPSSASGGTAPVSGDVTPSRPSYVAPTEARRGSKEGRTDAVERELIENPMYGMAGSIDDLCSAKRPLGEEQCSIRASPKDQRFLASEVPAYKRWHSAPDGHVTLRDVTSRPRLLHQESRVDMVKSYMRQATKHFFGLDESEDERNQARWLDRRRRLAARAYGQLRQDPCQDLDPYVSPAYHPRSLSDYGDVTDSSNMAALRRCRRKEHVAKMTCRGLGYLSTLVARGRLGSASQRTQSRSFVPSRAAELPEFARQI
ncbi:uncharacterized protein LOC119095083 [Pollicipes pollicipes]|uniref:uncharacterized protein LOC119095083 n=1 Tax=Pollicipes pollicipes TaxID=41117 RepID=UPI001884D845|nr:uncharacterized protein LOC119095083 [Pollicipes pollicipes]